MLTSAGGPSWGALAARRSTAVESGQEKIIKGLRAPNLAELKGASRPTDRWTGARLTEGPVVGWGGARESPVSLDTSGL